MKAERIAAIDYIKAIAIVFILLTHTYETTNAYTSLLAIGRPFWIDMAVPIFMILSGFTYSLSSDNDKIESLKKWFSWSNMSRKLSRLLFPYSITLVIETVLFQIFAPKTWKELLYMYFTGGWGPGSYYTPILVQLIVLFPVLYLLFKKSPAMAFAVSFGIHLGFDILSNTIPIADWIYRLLIFRYFGFIIMGIALYYYREKISRKWIFVIAAMMVSAFYIWMCSYYGYVPQIFSKWTVTSLPTVFWAFGLVLIGFRFLNTKKSNFLLITFGIIGKASYHIFLTQMVYFAWSFVHFGFIINSLICIIVGVAFYFCDNELMKLIKLCQNKTALRKTTI